MARNTLSNHIQVTDDFDKSCGRKHLKLLLATAGTTATIILTLGLLFWNSQVEIATKLEEHIRINEMNRVETNTKLDAALRVLYRLEEHSDARRTTSQTLGDTDEKMELPYGCATRGSNDGCLQRRDTER